MSKRQHIHVFITLFIIGVSLLNISCDNRPQGVVSQGKMVDILYDYHLAQGMVSGLPSDSAHLVKAYMDAVFENNGITQAEFDSSMIYYHRRSDILADIYDELRSRFEEEENSLSRKIGSSEMLVFSEGGDTANIWSGRQLYVLKNGDLVKKHTFKVKCDSSFHQFDRFMMDASVAFVRENKEDRNYFVTLCLSLQYTNGRTVSHVLRVCSEGKQRLNIAAIDSTDIKSLSGFFYYEGKPGGRNIALVRDITLLRMHQQEEKADTTSQTMLADSLETRPAPVVLRRDSTTFLTPEQKREQTLEESKPSIKVEILDAPKVRTPNRDAKKRRRTR